LKRRCPLKGHKQREDRSRVKVIQRRFSLAGAGEGWGMPWTRTRQKIDLSKKGDKGVGSRRGIREKQIRETNASKQSKAKVTMITGVPS